MADGFAAELQRGRLVELHRRLLLRPVVKRRSNPDRFEPPGKGPGYWENDEPGLGTLPGLVMTVTVCELEAMAQSK